MNTAVHNITIWVIATQAPMKGAAALTEPWASNSPSWKEHRGIRKMKQKCADEKDELHMVFRKSDKNSFPTNH